MEAIENIYDQFVHYILPIIIIFFGLIGNLLGLITFSNSTQLNKEIGPINMYRYIFITDSFILFSFVQVYLSQIYSMGTLLFSNFTCKLTVYLTYSFCSLSSFLLIYILIERYLSIKYPVFQINLLRSNKIQFIYLFFLFIINLVYYSPLFFYFNLIELQITTNSETEISLKMCTIDPNKKLKIELITFVFRIILPLILILLCSFLLISRIYKTNNTMLVSYSDRERNIFKSDVQLSIISILFNLIQYCLFIPIVITYFIFNRHYQSSSFFLCLNIFYLGYAFNFYFLILANSLFRKEFYSIFKKKRSITVV